MRLSFVVGPKEGHQEPPSLVGREFRTEHFWSCTSHMNYTHTFTDHGAQSKMAAPDRQSGELAKCRPRGAFDNGNSQPDGTLYLSLLAEPIHYQLDLCGAPGNRRPYRDESKIKGLRQKHPPVRLFLCLHAALDAN